MNNEQSQQPLSFQYIVPAAQLPLESRLLAAILDGINGQNQLLGELLRQIKSSSQSGQQQQSLAQWQSQNPELAEQCQKAAEHLNGIWISQLNEFLSDVMDVEDNQFSVREFTDKWGHTIQALQQIMYVLALWGGPK
jgi:hypothetical protein